MDGRNEAATAADNPIIETRHAGAQDRPVRRQRRGLRDAGKSPGSPGSPREDARLRALSWEVPYRAMVDELKTRYKISVKKWRSHMSGVAYELTYRDGRIKRLIAAPRPRSPVSAAIFLHEVGHHAIGFRRYSPRCQEEYYVWQWVFREMAAREIPANARVLRHYRRSMYHYVRLARRLEQHVPHDLVHFGHWPG